MSRFKKICKITALIVFVIVIVIVIVSVVMFWKQATRVLGRDYLEDMVIEHGKHTLIIKQWGAIGGTGAEIYYQKGIHTKFLGAVHMDDCVYSFRDGNYTIDWKDDTVIIRYFSGTRVEKIRDPSTWRTKEFSLP